MAWKNQMLSVPPFHISTAVLWIIHQACLEILALNISYRIVLTLHCIDHRRRIHIVLEALSSLFLLRLKHRLYYTNAYNCIVNSILRLLFIVSINLLLYPRVIINFRFSLTIHSLEIREWNKFDVILPFYSKVLTIIYKSMRTSETMMGIG